MIRVLAGCAVALLLATGCERPRDKEPIDPTPMPSPFRDRPKVDAARLPQGASTGVWTPGGDQPR